MGALLMVRCVIMVIGVLAIIPINIGWAAVD